MTLQLTGSDRNGSPLFTRSAGVNSLFCWSPFGGSAPRSGSSLSLPGFNGERQDPLSGVTHLGNGYRAYSPMLRRFACPDNESPFGVGGINPYVYCDNDPINRTDPSGHGPITWLIRKVITLGLRITLEEVGGMSAALSTTGMVETGLELASSASTGIASGVMKKKGNPEMAQKLGWASMGLGLAGGFGLATGDAAAIRCNMRRTSRRYSFSEDSAFQVMGGQMENINVSGKTHYMFMDNHKGGKRLNIVAHGRKFGSLALMSLGDDEYLGPEGLPRLIEKSYDISSINSFRLVMCYSGMGEDGSFAAIFSRLVNKPVKGYVGRVIIKNPRNAVDSIFNLHEKYLSQYGKNGEGMFREYVSDYGTFSVVKSSIDMPLSMAHEFAHEPIVFGQRTGGGVFSKLKSFFNA